MPPVGFEPAISAGERPQTYTSDRAATGTGFTDAAVANKDNCVTSLVITLTVYELGLN